MPNREITFYSLLSSENLRHIEEMADKMPEESFVKLGFEEKWLPHLWVGANNEAFIELISNQTDLLKLDKILGEQLKLYGKKHGEGQEQDDSDFERTYKARMDWLKHTKFICANEYNKSRDEIYNEAVNWCNEWELKYLPSLKPKTKLLKTLERVTENITRTALKVVAEGTERHINLIQKELNEAITIQDKKEIVLKRIKEYKQDLATPLWKNDFEEKHPELPPIPEIRSVPRNLIDWLELELEYLEKLSPQCELSINKGKSEFSILEWATIFYYADETKLLSNHKTTKVRMEKFMASHEIDTTFVTFRTRYYEAKRRINVKNDYPTKKLETIIPFLERKYPQTVTIVENDIILLEENRAEY